MRIRFFIPSFLLLVLTLSAPLSAQWSVISPPDIIHHFVSVSFADEMTGFAVGTVDLTSGTGGVQGLVARTTDGGETWKFETFNQISLNSVYAVDANTVYVAGGGRNCGCPFFMRSIDGGKTWDEQMLENVPGAFQAVDFYDAETGAVGGGDPENGTGYVYRIFDGSTELNLAHQNELTHISRLDMVSRERVFAAGGEEAGGENTIFVTENFTAKGAVSWQTAGMFDGFVSIGSFDFVSEEVGYAALTSFDGGEFTGDVYKTANGGKDWERVFSSANFTLVGIDFLDANNGFAVGANGAIVNTTNGGADWEENVTFSAQLLTWVEFVSSTTAYAVGTDGTVMKYTAPAWLQEEKGTATDVLRVSIAPTPIRSSATVRLEGGVPGTDYRLSLFDALGREVRAAQVIDGGGELQTEGLPEGAYFYRLLREGEVVAGGGVTVQ